MGRQTSAPSIVGLEVSVLSHATEDQGKVEQAVLNMIPEGVDTPGLKVQRLKGHHNDPIVMMTVRIRRRKAADKVFRNLLEGLSPPDRQRLLDDAETRVDQSGNLHLRLDKQSAYLGRAVLHEMDPIRIKFRFRIPPGIERIGAVRASIAEAIDKIELENSYDRGS